MKKILHIHFWDDIRNTASSVEKIILSFARNAVAFEHLVACRPTSNERLSPFSFQGVKVIPFRESQFINRLCNKLLRLDTFTYPDLVRVIHRVRPDVLHIHNRQDKVEQLVARLDYRPRVVVHYHRHFRNPIVPATADVLVFPSRATRDYVIGKTGTNTSVAVIDNPLSAELLARGASTLVPAPEAGRPLTFLFGGGANPIKGGNELLAAFARVKQPDVRLVFAGNGAAELVAACDDSRITSMERVRSEQFLALMQTADVVVVPSHSESFGLVAQEAMFLGKLLVSTQVDGLAEVVPEDAAVIVPVGSVDGLLQGLQRAYAICGNPDIRDAMVSRARRAMEKYYPQVVTHKLESEVYQ